MKSMIRTLSGLGLTAAALALAGCGGGTNCADQRYATVAWTISDAVTGQPLRCEDVGATTVILNFGSDQYIYPCNRYTGSTAAGYSPGSYPADMQLLAADGTVLSDTVSGSGEISAPINSCQPDDLPTTPFDV